MAGDLIEPLLKKKVYVHGCPGCEQDRRKETYTGIPYKELFFVCIATLCATIPISSLFPFLYFMIRDLHVAKRVEDIGFYAGFVGSAIMVGRIFTSLLWGMVADRYGRKPVIMISIFSVIIFNTLFGLSTTYWMALVTRFLLGFMNGILGSTKAYATEVGREEHQALGLSILSTTRGIGQVIGPAIGGFLSQETLHKHGKNDMENRSAETQGVCQIDPELKENSENTEGRDFPSNENLLKNWPLMSAIMGYCVFSLLDMAFSEIFSLFAVSDKKYGGLSFSSADVGKVLSLAGFCLILYQLLLYPYFARISSPISSARVAAVITIPLLAAFPFMTNLSGFILLFVVTCAAVLKSILSVTILTSMDILQNNAVPQHQRGTANGISVTAMSVFKAIAPACGGVLFSWAQKRQHASFFPGDHMVFLVLNIVGFIGTLMTFKPFLALSSKKYAT